MPEIIIRPLKPEERLDWERLWRSYLAFYETSLPRATYDVTWARLNDPKGRAVMARLNIVCDASLNPRSPGAFPCAMRATGTDGRAYLAEVLDPPGFSRKGIDPAAVLRKFNSITSHRLGPSSRQRIVDAAMAFDTAPSCAQLTEALAKASKA